MGNYKNLKAGERKYSVQYLRFEEGTPKEVTVSDWDFSKGSSGFLFKCYVTKEDNVEVDKIWTVWDYESAIKLKKKLGAKYTSGKKIIKAVMHKNDEDDIYFEIQ
jgi:hypothetical protein